MTINSSGDMSRRKVLQLPKKHHKTVLWSENCEKEKKRLTKEKVREDASKVTEKTGERLQKSTRFQLPQRELRITHRRKRRDAQKGGGLKGGRRSLKSASTGAGGGWRSAVTATQFWERSSPQRRGHI